jgi:hypothetical protein
MNGQSSFFRATHEIIRLETLASYHGGLGSIPCQVIWDLWWIKMHCGEGSHSTSDLSVSSQSRNCYKFINHPSI